jgi:hypothetical protein
MSLFTTALIISTGLQVMGQRRAGKSAVRTAALDAYNVETDRKLGKVQANENALRRLEEYRQNQSSNIATFSAAGRDISADMSVKAFLKNQKETVGKDLKTIARTGSLQAAKATQEAYAIRSEGRARKQSATIGALTSVASGLAQYSEIKVG